MLNNSLLRDDFESLKCYLDPCIACSIAFMLCFSLLEKPFLSNLNTSRHLAYLSSSSVAFYNNLDTSR